MLHVRYQVPVHLICICSRSIKNASLQNKSASKGRHNTMLQCINAMHTRQLQNKSVSQSVVSPRLPRFALLFIYLALAKGAASQPRDLVGAGTKVELGTYGTFIANKYRAPCHHAIVYQFSFYSALRCVSHWQTHLCNATAVRMTNARSSSSSSRSAASISPAHRSQTRVLGCSAACHTRLAPVSLHPKLRINF